MPCRGYFKNSEKKSWDEIYGREGQFDKLTQHISKGRQLIAIKGVRRVGKSTFIWASLDRLERLGKEVGLEIKTHVVKCDGTQTIDELRSELYEILPFSEESTAMKLKEVTIGVENFIPSGTMTFTPDTRMAAVFRKMSESGIGTLYFIALDEVQDFEEREKLMKFFNYVHSSVQNLFIILSGSQVTTFQEFLDAAYNKLDSVHSKKYKGRIGGIHMTPFDMAQSVEFLTRGFRDNKALETDEQRKDIALQIYRHVGGIPAWLVEAGCDISEAYIEYGEINKLLLDEILHEIEREAMTKIESEIDTIAEMYGATIYDDIGRIMRGIPNYQISRKKLLEYTGLEDKRFERAMEILTDYGYIIEDETAKTVTIPDVIIWRFFHERS